MRGKKNTGNKTKAPGNLRLHGRHVNDTAIMTPIMCRSCGVIFLAPAVTRASERILMTLSVRMGTLIKSLGRR